MAQTGSNLLRLGVDVGSTTVKTVVLDPTTNDVLFTRYQRHNAHQADTVRQLLEEAAGRFPDARFRVGVCGSGGRPIATVLGAQYVQEVVANAAAIRALYPQVRTAVELGGQDAKVIFFHYDESTGKLQTSDMRMNGSCAGGTGAFIDEIAALLSVPADEFEQLAAQGKTVYSISGRCGVFAKTDIQPLLIQGAERADIALSTFHAIAKQTIGGLSQGLELTAPIIFEGGPLTFNPTLVRVFAQRLGLREEEIVRPEHPETIVARGTAIALDELFPGEKDSMTLSQALERLAAAPAQPQESAGTGKPYFASAEERDAFLRRHQSQLRSPVDATDRKVLRGYLGIDSGSTTSKFVFMDEQEQVTDTFYANNQGEPLRVVRQGLLALAEKYRKLGIQLEVLGLGTTGYGEQMLSQAFHADYHTVETVAHARGCRRFFPDATFLLDIGGQDMKAIWLKDGVVTNIMLNEACSSGCGSFLENFASTLGMPVDQVADAAFRSQAPAELGSRCTVFMNSTIINEQRNGKQPDDLMAGLCRSIIENVFTKVVRIANVSELGDTVVVQGGTFRNFAVLRALEEYLGREVTLAPYPGEMGALGAALAVKQEVEAHGYANGRCSSFIGFDAVEQFQYVRESGVVCPHCANHCSRTILRFPDGGCYVTGNRCDRGAVVTEDAAAAVKPAPVPDLFHLRQELLFKKYPVSPVRENQKQTVGLPRVLEFWDSMPFWSTFFRALGYEVCYSHPSSRKQYESGLQYVASDTICFPAKLVHGHVLDLAKQGVDRIFLPYILHMPTENQKEKSPYVCPVIMGYSMVVRNFQDPEEHFSVAFETPVFHWFTEQDRKRQICQYAMEHCGATKRQAEEAFRQGAAVIEGFRRRLVEEGTQVIAQTQKNGSFAVVLAGRPYHTDPLINHDLSRMFTRRGIPVLTVDSLPGLPEADLHQSRVEITNDFHARMLSGAMVTAQQPALEYVQIVSFGCGHDAILSDEIIRLLGEGSGKPPLILKVDESEAAGSLGIRVQSFIETVELRRAAQAEKAAQPDRLPEPYPVKYRKADRKLRTVLVPNISAPVSTLLSALLDREGIRAQALPVGGPEQIRVGKKYTHNDICFPCQMVIGELIDALQKGHYPEGSVAVGMAKLSCDCRMANYTAILRKALDSAGFADVPILTTDPGDTKGIHPGVSMLGARSVLLAAWAFSMLDILEDLCRKIRPYETVAGETNRVFQACIEDIAAGSKEGLRKMIAAFRRSINAFRELHWDRSVRKPRVLVTGELLVTYHPGTNFHVEEYLERNGMETVLPRITYQFRKDFQAAISEIRDFGAHLAPYPFALDSAVEGIQRYLERIAQAHPLYQKAVRPQELYDTVRTIIPKTLTCGEGWLMAGEIAHYAAQGVRSFIILQPFGCLPNHVCGRGVTKRLKEWFPGVQILPLDLDPDTSYANVENRLQMLIMNQTAEAMPPQTGEEAAYRKPRSSYQHPALSST
ncbi:acyl-CoA dehydratase activase [Dysosmobacter sp.]|jgi:predicted CoA-substrate-specific enzyme activase|uniref:acyl-CoA dehydratase activase n=1 Tax=Dysosmobacter sp. TaxID=2591382 RepID=UPI003D8F50B4